MVLPSVSLWYTIPTGNMRQHTSEGVQGAEEKIPQECKGIPNWVRAVSQPLLRHLLLFIANYHVKVEGKIPTTPSFLFAYPHGEHANSILLPSRNITYVAARDTFYKSRRQQVLLSTLLNTLPISRAEDFSKAGFQREVAAMQEVVETRHHHLLVYPQGTRRGPAESAEELEQQLKQGIFLMLKELGIPAVPVGIVYQDDYNPAKGVTDVWRVAKQTLPHLQRPPRRDVVVRFGEEIDASSMARRAFMHLLAQELFQLTKKNESPVR